MTIVPLDRDGANRLVLDWHRHHKPVIGYRFAIGADSQGGLVGAAICGRPVSREVNHKTVLEVTRLVTNGTRNACSFLYAACARIAREMGFKKIQTYILASEPGTSLRAAGWVFEAIVPGRDWNCKSRSGRRTDQPLEDKQRWAKLL